MLVILPVENQSWPVIVPMALLILLTLYWVIPPVIQGIRRQLKLPNDRLMVLVIGGFVGVALVLFLAIIYIQGSDLSVAPRYHFVYFPAFLLVIAAALAMSWQPIKSEASALQSATQGNWFSRLPRLSGRQVVIWVVLMGLIGSMTVVSDLSFRKSRHPDVLAAEIAQAKTPTLVAVGYETHAEIRSTIAIGYELARSAFEQASSTKFLLLKEKEDSRLLLTSLTQGINSFARPLNLWTINLPKKLDLSGLNCQKSHRNDQDTGYSDRHYLCK
jgi:hypothetical protein